MNILLGITGSVAANLTPKLHTALLEIGDVTTIATKSALNFIPSHHIPHHCELYTDEDEWSKWHNGKSVLHIDLRRKASVLVIAPLDANTLAKMANGICDNLLTCVVRAWDRTRPIVIAPSMNTYMWEHPATQEHIDKLRSWYKLWMIDPVEKTLVCGDTGMGAMGKIESIVDLVRHVTRWNFPLQRTNGIPVGNHPGAFGYKRKYDHHTGVDLYCDLSYTHHPVYTVEAGTVVQIEDFTGAKDNSPWWNDTKCVMIEGASGVVNYGEIQPNMHVYVGAKIDVGKEIGRVIPVLPEGKERPDLPGHSRAMLHVELYKHGVRKASSAWKHDGPMPEGLKDPTSLLLNANTTLLPFYGSKQKLECQS